MKERQCWKIVNQLRISNISVTRIRLNPCRTARQSCLVVSARTFEQYTTDLVPKSVQSEDRSSLHHRRRRQHALVTVHLELCNAIIMIIMMWLCCHSTDCDRDCNRDSGTGTASGSVRTTNSESLTLPHDRIQQIHRYICFQYSSRIKGSIRTTVSTLCHALHMQAFQRSHTDQLLTFQTYPSLPVIDIQAS